MKYLFLTLTVLTGLLLNAQIIPKNASKIDAVKKGKIKIAKASWWGFNPTDSTANLQAALDSKVTKLIIDKQSSPWIVKPIFARSNMEIIFEENCELLANKNEYKDRYDCLLNVLNVKNVTIKGLGKGGIMRMHKKDYQDKNKHIRGEWRHCLNVKNSTNFLVENMKIYSSGGDGVYLCLVNNAVVRNVLCDDHHRQGCSIIGGHNILIENCQFNNTKGTSPESGLDIEPNNTQEPLKKIVIRNCKFINNFRWGILVAATRVDSNKAGEMDILFENCIAQDNREGDIYAYTRTEFKTGDPIRGKIDFINCQAISNRKDSFYRPPVEVDLDLHHQLKVNFKNLTIRRGVNPSKAIQINFNHPLSANSTPQGKINFENLKLVDVVANDTLQINDYSFSGTNNWISGYLTDKTGKQQKIDAIFLKASKQLCEKEYPILPADQNYVVNKKVTGSLDKYPEFPFILSADYWLAAKAGEKVTFTLKYIKNGRWSRDAATVTLIAPDGSKKNLGKINPASNQTFSFVAKEAGIYKTAVRGFYLKTALIASTVPAGPIAKEFENELDRVVGTLYFYVPKNTKNFAVRIWGRGFVNAVNVSICNPQGKVVYSNPAVAGSGVQLNFSGQDALQGGIWRMNYAKPRKYWYDRCFFRLMGTSPYLGLRPDRMVVKK